MQCLTCTPCTPAARVLLVSSTVASPSPPLPSPLLPSLPSTFLSTLSPGCFRAMQEVQLDKHVKLLDSPGIVMAKDKDYSAAILRNSVRVSSGWVWMCEGV